MLLETRASNHSHTAIGVFMIQGHLIARLPAGNECHSSVSALLTCYCCCLFIVIAHAALHPKIRRAVRKPRRRRITLLSDDVPLFFCATFPAILFHC